MPSDSNNTETVCVCDRLNPTQLLLTQSLQSLPPDDPVKPKSFTVKVQKSKKKDTENPKPKLNKRKRAPMCITGLDEHTHDKPRLKLIYNETFEDPSVSVYINYYLPIS